MHKRQFGFYGHNVPRLCAVRFALHDQPVTGLEKTESANEREGFSALQRC